ncbi:STAS domain-containing protein [Alkalihalophilus marmarensis]|uniref:STAS domain-containing protein n=1 Tax=Alkalihalophilus marmarensis TaxID=521377 RepID=UPI002E2245A6|nr:STAS domain-containing protein [Alkalihalophilus marmarensis]
MEISSMGKEANIYIQENVEEFKEMLLSEAVNVSSKINDILKTGNIDLLKNAQRLTRYVLEQEDDELIAFANQEGEAWASHSLTLSLKLEWVQAIRRTIWKFVNDLDSTKRFTDSRNDFFELEKMINDRVDQFLNNFFIQYSCYKDEMLNKQRQIVEHLSVPIIPVQEHVSVLPLIGTVDSYRIQIIEEKVLHEIAEARIQTLILDLSGIAVMEKNVIDQLDQILAGASMMGCKAILTGLRPDLVKNMVKAGIRFENDTDIRGTLQDTLKDYL